MEKNYKILMACMGMEIGGAETHVMELCKTLKARGLDVHVVSNGGVYVKELEACGVKHYKVPLHNKQFLNVTTSYRAIKKIILENNIGLVHSHARIPAFICGILQKRLNFRLVTTAHLNFSVAFPFNKLTNWGERVLAVSGDIKNYLLENYKVEEKNICITVNGIDTEKFSPDTDTAGIKSELGLDGNKRKIVSVSRLDRDRSMPARMLIEAALEIAEIEPVEIIIVGGGDDFESIREKAGEVNKKAGYPLIYLTGQRTDIHTFMALADIFINVSRSALEALAAAKPLVLAGNQGYIGIFGENVLDAAVETNFTCRGCGEPDREKLFHDIKALLNKPKDELEALGRYGRDIVSRFYSLDKMADDAVAVYEDILKSPPAARLPVKNKGLVISGYYGYRNSGDDILLQSIIENLRAYQKDLPMTVLSMKPKETRAQYKVGAVYRFNFLSVFLRLRKARLLITGAGSVIQDETSTQSLIYYLWVINTARFLGVKNMLYANGIGPVSKPKNRERVRRALNKVDLITLREHESLQVLKEIGVTVPETHVTADAAFALPPADEREVREYVSGLGITRPFFCISLRSWTHNPPQLEEQAAKFADCIIDTYAYQALFVPMRPAEDTAISRKVISLMKNPAILALPAAKDINKMRGAVGSASFVLGMRLHALIYAMEKGVPVIGLVYSPKIRQFMESMGQHFFLPVEKTDTKILIQYAEDIHADKEAISEEICKAGSAAREKAALNAALCMGLLGDA